MTNPTASLDVMGGLRRLICAVLHSLVARRSTSRSIPMRWKLSATTSTVARSCGPLAKAGQGGQIAVYIVDIVDREVRAHLATLPAS